MRRRDFLTGVAAVWPMATFAHHRGPGVTLGAPLPFDEGTLRARAEAMATAPFAPRAEIPRAWQALTYDQYRSIWFRDADALWHEGPGPLQVDFFPPGLYFPRPVKMFTVEGGYARAVAFDLGLFDRTDTFPDLPVDDTLGYSGLRLRAETQLPGIFQEFAVFQGASYFRAIGRGETYGLSARGLALDTAEPTGEEFPEFTEFYLEAPAIGAATFTLHALLDSPSLAGVYRFDIQIGTSTVMDVRATLFPRRALGHAGMAPLTSMFLFDGKTPGRFSDFRPAVHDSDGLEILNGAGERLWRALANPVQLQISSFVDQSPKGFGLMQRSRRYSDFADLEAHYHERPGLWIEPVGDWGAGAVTLVEIPTDKEVYDNIVAYWRPAAPIPAGMAHDFAYRMTWGAGEPAETGGVARVLSTRMGLQEDGRRIAVVDFAPHVAVPLDLAEVTVHTSANVGGVSPGILQRNPETGGTRLAFSFDPGGQSSVELRAQMLLGGARISEVWLYRWTV